MNVGAFIREVGSREDHNHNLGNPPNMTASFEDIPVRVYRMCPTSVEKRYETPVIPSCNSQIVTDYPLCFSNGLTHFLWVFLFPPDKESSLFHIDVKERVRVKVPQSLFKNSLQLAGTGSYHIKWEERPYGM